MTSGSGMANRSDMKFREWSAVLVACVFAAAGAPALAQNGYSQPVVQPTPPPALDELNAALRRLGDKVGGLLLRDAAEKGAEIIAAEAKRLAPRVWARIWAASKNSPRM